MGLRPLGIVKEFVEASGMGISYVYEDLVFVDHNALLLQFTESENSMLIHVNKAAEESKLGSSLARLKAEALAREMQLHDGGYYAISQGEDEQVRLEFFNSK